MENFRIQASFWCKKQARLFVVNVESKFSGAGLLAPSFTESMEDHRPKTLGMMESTDEIDILFDDDQCPSVHFLIEVDTKAEADLIVQAAEAATMQLILMPLGDSLTDSPIRILKPFVDVS